MEAFVLKALGIIAEYNPFHNGHRFHIRASQEKVYPDATIVVMSGPFVQRGTPAVLDKWQRCRIALAGGADLVCELPVPWATAGAEKFAEGAVAILDALHCAYLSFGSESGDIESLKKIAHLLSEEPPVFQSELKKRLKHGASFAKSREEAVCSLLGRSAADVMTKPNNILGIEYLKVITRSHVHLHPITVKRRGALHDQIASDSFSSSAIRQLMRTDDIALASDYLPYPSQILKDTHFCSLETHFENFAAAKLLTASLPQLRGLPEVTEGLEFAFQNTARDPQGFSYQEIIDCVSSKRIPKSRVRRILFNLALNISKQSIDQFWACAPPYIRILGMNDRGRAFLAENKKNIDCPILINVKSNQTQLNQPAKEILELDMRAQNMWNYLHGDALLFQDYRHPPVLVL